MAPGPDRESGFDAHEAPTLQEHELRSQPGAADLLVLVVDDDPEARVIQCAALAHLGYRTLACTNGREALEVAASHRPDVVLTDASMPEVDGVEATRSLKKCRPETFVAVMTAYGEAYYDRACKSGCDAFLCKPFNPFVLHEILDALRRRKDVEVVKRCGCGREWTRAEWRTLPYCGAMSWIELRQCACGSSLALPLDRNVPPEPPRERGRG